MELDQDPRIEEFSEQHFDLVTGCQTLTIFSSFKLSYGMNDEKPNKQARLTPQSVKLINQLVRQIPPQTLVRALTVLYITHFDAEKKLPEDYEQFQRPLYMLITTLRKLEVK